jgi:uncharacterized protein YaeQ
MANPSTLYRFRLQVSDIDRNFYDALDFRIAMHPSEASPFLITRVLAYALNFQEGLEFSPEGLADPESPCLQVRGIHGGYKLWIEIGSPNAKKAHKASKGSDQLKIYTYKDPANLTRELTTNTVHRANEIEIYSLNSAFLERLAATLERDNSWNVTHSEGSLVVNIGATTVEGELLRHPIR